MKGIKNMVRGVLVYLILTMGIWMFLYSYANSYNRLTDEKIPAAEILTDKGSMTMRGAGMSYNISTEIFSAESDFYFAAYMFIPTELRLLCAAECAWEKKFGL